MRKMRSFSRLVRIGFCLLLWVEALLPCRADSPASPFASGKWVKVAVSKSGVYRITYEALRKAGFASPERVGVYGYGGALLSERLADAPRETLPPVPVVQQGDALYFYGEGTTTVHYNAAKARYERSLNHYATEGYYFLSDVAEPVLMSGESPAACLLYSADALYSAQTDNPNKPYPLRALPVEQLLHLFLRPMEKHRMYSAEFRLKSCCGSHPPRG